MKNLVEGRFPPLTCYFFLVRAPIISAERAGGFRETDGENSCGGKWWIIKRFHFLALCASPSRATRMTFPNKITDPTFDREFTRHIFLLLPFFFRTEVTHPNKFIVSTIRKIGKFDALLRDEYSSVHPIIVAQHDLHRGLLSERAQFIDLIKRPSSRFPKRSAFNYNRCRG